MSKKLKVLTYGCQMNMSESERIIGILRKSGYELVDKSVEADLIVINTCCVRETAENKILGEIGRLKVIKRQKPSLIIGVIGCMAQKEGDGLIKRAPHIDFVLGTGQIAEIGKVVKNVEERGEYFVNVSEVDKNISLESVQPVRKDKVSTFVPIMYGCNNYCTYCIVPYVRGRERSRSAEEIKKEIISAIDEGFRDVTLLGQNVNSYSGGMNFAKLLLMIDRISENTRLRFMTSHPKDLSNELIEVMAGGKNICEHLHLPVQHGSNKILKKMNRAYTAEKYLRLVEKLRSFIPNISLTTDLIVGFPGETEEDFQEMLNFLRAVEFDTAFTYMYSKRTGTPAATFKDQVDEGTKRQRLSKLMEIQNEISLRKNLSLEGKVVEVLVEGASKTNKEIFSGRTRSNKLVIFKHFNEMAGDLINVRITQAQTWLLKAELIQK